MRSNELGDRPLGDRPLSDRPLFREMFADRLGRVSIRSLQIIILVTLTYVVLYALVQVKLVVIPTIIALIIAAAISPVVNWLRRRNVPSALATWLVILVGLVLFGGLTWLIVFAVSNQWSQLAKSASDGLDQLQHYLIHGPLPIDHKQIENARSALVDFVTSAQFGAGALTGVSVATQLITGVLLGFVIMFFFVKDGQQIWNFCLRPFHGARLERGRRIGHTVLSTLGGYVHGTAIIAFVDAAAIGAGLFILQVPLALPLAVIVFLTAFIPIIGATIAGVLAALVSLVTNGPVVALIVIGIVVLVNQLEGNLLQPVVMSQSLKLHPLVILVALTIGTILAGVVGALLAVPIAACTWAVIKVWNPPADTA